MVEGASKLQDPWEVLAVARRAALDAGDLLLHYLGNLKSSQVRSKSAARDLVTEADLESERLIVARLREAFPEHRIEAEEETRDEPSSGAGDDAPRWYIDPLDGTVNFVHRIPAFAVSLGLYVAGRPEIAVVHLPRLGETFTAIRGHGARLDGGEIYVSDATDLGDAILATGFPYRRNQVKHSNLENFGRFFYEVRGMRRMGSAALDLAYVAAGRLDGFWELHLSPHDVAAGALLVREAGGIVTDADGGDRWLEAGHIVAAGPALHEQIRARIEHGE